MGFIGLLLPRFVNLPLYTPPAPPSGRILLVCCVAQYWNDSVTAHALDTLLHIIKQTVRFRLLEETLILYIWLQGLEGGGGMFV